MSKLPSGLLDRLREKIPEPALDEVANIVDQLADDMSCLVTGSLVEGIGNVHSDVDFYLIQPAGVAARPVSIGIRGARYVDCEYLSADTVARLADRFADSSIATLVGLNHRDFNRYYRLTISIPVVVTADLAATIRRCDKARACDRFGAYSSVQAYQHLARAAVCHALDRPRNAHLLLREAALWRASQILADAGEGYPSLKWTDAKAARRFGTGSQDYHDCLAGYFGPVEDLAAELANARTRIAPPTAALTFMNELAWTIDDRVKVVTANGVRYHVLGGRSIGWVDGAAGMIVTQLSLGSDWPEAVADVSAKLALAEDEVVAASFADLRALSEAGFLCRGGDRDDDK